MIEGGEGDYKEEILTLNDLAQKLRAARFQNGAIAFDRIEVRFDIDENGKPTGVYFKRSKEANKLIEEFMLLANKKVAERIGKVKENQKAKTFVYRIHEQPNTEKLEDFGRFIAKFGYRIRTGTPRQISSSMNKLMEDVPGPPGTEHDRNTGYPHDGKSRLLDGERGTLRTGFRLLFALHVTDPSVPGRDDPPLAATLPRRRTFSQCREVRGDV